MADQDSSLPVRTQTDGDVVAKISDGTTPSQHLAVDAAGKIFAKLNDGVGNLITSQTQVAQQVLDVGINVGGVQIDPRQVRALTAADVVTANQGAPNSAANGWPVKPTDGTNSQSFTAAGEAKVSVTQPLPAGANNIGSVNQGTSPWVTSVNNLPATVDTNFGTVGASTIRVASEIGNATGAADFNFGTVGAQTIRTAAEVGNATGAADYNNGATGAQTLRVAANLAVAGANVSSSNPVPVAISAAPLGTSVDDYLTSASVAGGAAVNHDYTVTALKTLLLKQIEATGSGKAKIEVRIETGVATGVFTTKFVQFNSTSTPNMSINLQDPISVAAGVRVRVVRTNRDLTSQDLYSTICGQEI